MWTSSANQALTSFMLYGALLSVRREAETHELDDILDEWSAFGQALGASEADIQQMEPIVRNLLKDGQF